jgi:hypothetical protein
MELKERSFEARAAYLEGYRAGEDNMQLQVLRILQSTLSDIVQSRGSIDVLRLLERQAVDIKNKVLNIPLLSCVAKVNEKDKRE